MSDRSARKGLFEGTTFQLALLRAAAAGPVRKVLSAAAPAAAAALAAPALAADEPATTKPAAPAAAPAPVPAAPSGVSASDLEPPSEQRLVFPVSPTRPEPSRNLLMGLLDKGGLAKPLDDARIRMYGHVEGSFTYNADDPFRNANLGRVFDIEDQSLTLNQVTLNFQRDVIVNARDFDVGGRVELMYGGDARFIKANGLLDHHDDDVSERLVPGPKAQFDITQAYVDVNLPVGDGLRLRVGKFTYFKQIDPNASVFYSHSFSFGSALPFTLTGIYGTYQLNEKLTFDAGISRGWDQCLEDNNGAIDGFGRIKYNFDDKTSLTAAFITGPEQEDDNGNWRTAIDVTLTHQASDNLLFLFDAVYGQQAGADFVTIIPGTLGGGGFEQGTTGTAMWYGLSGYAVYKINDQISAAARGEWYRDQDGFTTSVKQTLFEVTLGLTITPFPNDPVGQFFKIRPEVRWDYSTEPFFDGFTRHDQWTMAVDAIFNF